MTDCTCNGIDVFSAIVTRPYHGAWRARAELDVDAAVSGTQVLQILGVTYVGTVWTDPDGDVPASGHYAGKCIVSIIGGAGGLGTKMTALAYDNGATVQQVLVDLLTAGNEALSALVAPDLLERLLPQWAWNAERIDSQLSQLADYLGVIWRVLADGTVWLGIDDPATAPSVSLVDYVLVDMEPDAGVITVTAEAIDWAPGQILDGLAIKQVQHVVAGSGARTLVTYKPGAAGSLNALLWRFLRRAGWDWARPQPGVVAEQNQDGTLQVQLDDDRYSPLRRVYVATGLPDTVVAVAPGSRVLVEWPRGNPTRPTVTAWGDSAATSINIAASAGSDAMVKGTTYRNAEAAFHSALRVNLLIAGVQLAAAGANPAFAAAFSSVATALAAAGAALGATGAAKDIADFEAQASTFLSIISKTG